jgi:phage repressor protein C with HTH and peptisase S24 domain
MNGEFGVNEFVERLRLVVGDESVNGFAKRAQIPEGSLRQYLAGSIPGVDKAARIANAGGVLLDWLLIGRQPMRAELAGTRLDASGVPSEFALLPRYSVQASAGNGLVAAEEIEVERIAFRLDWLREMGLDPNQAGLLTAQGDSMYPTIPDGALILVDRRPDQAIRSGFVYVIVLGGEVLVKRVSRNVDGTIDLISDNAVYPVQTVRQTEFDQLLIAGRVFWIGRKL